MVKQRPNCERMLTPYSRNLIFINIRYTFIFYFPKIFCPNFSVKNLLIPKGNVLSDL